MPRSEKPHEIMGFHGKMWRILAIFPEVFACLCGRFVLKRFNEFQRGFWPLRQAIALVILYEFINHIPTLEFRYGWPSKHLVESPPG